MTPMATMDMAKKRAAKPKSEAARKPLIAQIRGTEEFRTWLQVVADRDGRSIAGLIDRAVRIYAEQIGVKEPAPKR